MTAQEWEEAQRWTRIRDGEAWVSLSRSNANERDAISMPADIWDGYTQSQSRIRELEQALREAWWMMRWQFDEHRTGGAGELRDWSSCRCDWCKTYRDSEEERFALHLSLNSPPPPPPPPPKEVQ